MLQQPRAPGSSFCPRTAPMRYEIAYQGLSGALSAGGHVHTGAVGVSGGVVRAIAKSGDPAADVVRETWKATDSSQPLTPALVDSAIAGKLYAMARTIITATCGDSDTALKQMKVFLDQNDHDPLSDFGYALALSRNARHEEAIGYLRAALEKQAAHPQILAALAIEYVLTGYYDKALEIFKKTPQTPYWDFKKTTLLVPGRGRNRPHGRMHRHSGSPD